MYACHIYKCLTCLYCRPQLHTPLTGVREQAWRTLLTQLATAEQTCHGGITVSLTAAACPPIECLYDICRR